MGTRGCINYNPTIALKQLGYPITHGPTEELTAHFIIYGLSSHNVSMLRKISTPVITKEAPILDIPSNKETEELRKALLKSVDEKREEAYKKQRTAFEETEQKMKSLEKYAKEHK
ncbi:hypothetical protein CR513_10844, partial [Mucuna pruriens]